MGLPAPPSPPAGGALSLDGALREMPPPPLLSPGPRVPPRLGIPPVPPPITEAGEGPDLGVTVVVRGFFGNRAFAVAGVVVICSNEKYCHDIIANSGTKLEIF